MTNKIISLKFLTSILTIAFITLFAYQTKVSAQNTVVAVPANSAADELKVQVKAPNYKIKEKTLAYLQTLSTPEIKLVSEANKFSADLPAETEDVLNAHWREAIKFTFEEQTNPVNGQEGQKRDSNWMRFCLQTSEKLQKAYINAPNGRRRISHNESGKIFGGLNRAAVDLLVKAGIIK